MVEHTDPFYKNIAATIKRTNRQIIGVMPEKKLVGFAYTIGNHLKGVPELLILGNFETEAWQSILNHLSDQMIDLKAQFLDGMIVDIGGKYGLQVWDTTMIAKLEYTRQATEFYQHSDYAVQQVVVPDPKGRYPADKGCHRRYRVPLLRSTVAIMQSITRH
jgi:Domain of unknown function (DUF4262)